MALVAFNLFFSVDEDQTELKTVTFLFVDWESLIAFLHASVMNFIPEDINVCYLYHFIISSCLFNACHPLRFSKI